MFFEYPKLLWLLLLLVPVVAIYIYREAKGLKPYLLVSSATPWKYRGGVVKKWARHLPFVLRTIALAAMIVAIARPRSSSKFERIDTEGIDIVLALDVSTSMLARDFNPDRIGAAKDIAIQFIAERPSDRIGVVVFAGESYTQSPLTTDRATLINLIKEIECGIRVYTIGVGAEGTAPYPVMTPFGIDIQQVEVQIDEALLQDIADQTDGKYFRATDNTKLLEIYGEINKMEKNKTLVDSFPIYQELFMNFALIALAALVLELLLRLFVTKQIPD